MKLTRRHLVMTGAFGATVLALPGRAWASAPATVRGVLVTETGPASRVAVALDRQTDTRSFFLPNPNRFVVDLIDARWTGGQCGQGPGAGIVTRYRYGPRPDGSARLVLDLEGPASL